MTDAIAVPTAKQVYSRSRAVLDPLARSLGYRREKASPPTWTQSLPGPHTSFWLQVNARVIDEYTGGELTLEFERKLEGPTAAKLDGRARFDQLLTPDEVAEVIRRQNEVIRSLRRPPRDHVEGFPSSLRESYLREFEPQTTFMPGGLRPRYQTETQVDEWLSHLATLLPSLLERASHLDPKVAYLGKAIDLEAMRPSD